MAGQIKVKYADAHSKAAELRSNIATETEHMENEYQLIQSQLNGVDSAANAAIKEAMETNRQKTAISAMTLDKQLSFITASTQQVETSERQIKSIFAPIVNFFRGGKR